MNRIVRLTESDLARIVRRVMNEEVKSVPQGGIFLYGATFKDLIGSGEVYKGVGLGTVYGTVSSIITNATVTVTAEGTKLGLTAASLKVASPATYGYVIPGQKAVQHAIYPKPAVKAKLSTNSNPLVKVRTTTILDATNADAPYGQQISWGYTLTGPKKRYVNQTGSSITLFQITFDTNDSKKPIQTVNFNMGVNAQFGTLNVAPATNTTN